MHEGHSASPEFCLLMIAVRRFERRNLREIQLYPVDLGFGRPCAQRGRPSLADQQLRNIILDRLARVSEAFGTRIERRNDVGIIRAA
jgi:hypothetical protein